MVASAEAISPRRLPECPLDEFFDEVLAMMPCIGGEAGIDRSGKLGRVGVGT